jgi:hypothetical protein
MLYDSSFGAPFLLSPTQYYKIYPSKTNGCDVGWSGFSKASGARPGNHPTPAALFAITGVLIMRVFLGMILGALLLVAGVYIYDSMSTSTVAGGQLAQANRTIVNWDVAAADWNALKSRAHDDWIKLSSK